MRDGRKHRQRASGSAALLAGSFAPIGRRTWAKIVRRPVDTLAILGAAGASLAIIVNAVFLQSHAHPAPFVANPPQVQVPRSAPGPAVSAAPTIPGAAAIHGEAGTRASQPVALRHNDPIADLIGSSVGSPARVAAVQRVLSEFGYGQIRPSGIIDEPTSAAIEKFESEHKMPATGRLSERLLGELSILRGRPIE